MSNFSINITIPELTAEIGNIRRERGALNEQFGRLEADTSGLNENYQTTSSVAFYEKMAEYNQTFRNAENTIDQILAVLERLRRDMQEAEDAARRRAQELP